MFWQQFLMPKFAKGFPILVTFIIHNLSLKLILFYFTENMKWILSIMLLGLFFTNWIKIGHLKSNNLQYSTLVRWVAGTNDSSTKHLMFQVLFFFIISCIILFKNCFNLFFYVLSALHKSKPATHCFIFNLSK